MSPLPIDEILEPLRQALRSQPLVVLQAPPGAGKTTQVPLALLDEEWLAGKRIVMLEPRRIAARNAAHYMAQLLGEEAGERVGYRVRFESVVSAVTRVEVVTEGILTRRLQQDPELAGVGLLIFDEFHERHLDSDLALALARDIQMGLRDDLRMVVMSATLDGTALAERLGGVLLRSEGRSYPVTTHHLPRDPEGPIAATTRRAVTTALADEQGDLLVFLPGVGEIRQTEALLREDPACVGVAILPLYGEMALADQQRALQPLAAGGRRVILTTNIAETSLTIEGIRVVIDSGWQRGPRFDPGSGLTRLERMRISQASATQRAGRAGRLGPGVCYRLWSEATQRGLLQQSRPEIGSADLAPLVLSLAQWGVSDPEQLNWVDLPPAGAYAQARALLHELAAVDGAGRITRRGAAMARLPLHPRLAHMAIEGQRLGLAGLACDIAALLGERDILSGEQGRWESDLVHRLELLARGAGHRSSGRDGVDGRRLRQVARSAQQWRRLLQVKGEARWQGPQVGLLLAFAYPDRIARRRAGQSGRYLLSGGRGAVLHGGSLAAEEWLVAAEVTGQGREGTIRLAAALDIEQLLSENPALLLHRERIAWDEGIQAVLCETGRYLGAIQVDSRPLDHPDPEQYAQALLSGLRRQGLTLLTWSATTLSLCHRVTFLHRQFPDSHWPDLSEVALYATLEQWLLPYLEGVRGREGLKRLELLPILKGVIGWEHLEALERLAPERLVVPSGQSRAIDYTHPDEPTLAVKLQELFGLQQTPTLAEGRVAVTLHLLSPARRPIQITRDLANFWRQTYPEVKRELKGRYPKHPWPDDPNTAPATAGTKRRPGR